jgi:hypothetical protein
MQITTSIITRRKRDMKILYKRPENITLVSLVSSVSLHLHLHIYRYICVMYRYNLGYIHIFDFYIVLWKKNRQSINWNLKFKRSKQTSVVNISYSKNT